MTSSLERRRAARQSNPAAPAAVMGVRLAHAPGMERKKNIQWLGCAGSLRMESLNRALLEAAVKATPADASLEVFDLAGLPLYNQDRDNDARRPDRVRALKESIARADGLVLACPEYNYSISGVLKNAIDWASRPAYSSVLTHKPVAIIGASMAATGSARAQQALRGVLLGCACVVYPAPDIAVGRAQDKFDDGELSDDRTRGHLIEFLSDYAAFTHMIVRARAENLWPTRIP